MGRLAEMPRSAWQRGGDDELRSSTTAISRAPSP
jgi:hypothetical protein